MDTRVLASLIPIVIGHEASVVAVGGVAVATQESLAPHTVRLLAALALVSFGVYRISRPRSHPRGYGMRIGGVSLAAWSFLMSSAHGAGLMLVPVLLGWPVVERLPAADQMGTLVVVSGHRARDGHAYRHGQRGAGRLPGGRAPHPPAQLVQP